MLYFSQPLWENDEFSTGEWILAPITSIEYIRDSVDCDPCHVGVQARGADVVL